MLLRTGLAEVARLNGFGLGGTAFDYVALGTDGTAPAATQTALLAEITTAGGGRVLCTTSTSEQTNVADDTGRFVASWTFSGSLTIREFGVTNVLTVGGAGQAFLLRQTFADPYFAINGDTLQLTIDVVATGSSDANGLITNAGLANITKRYLGDESAGAAPFRSVAFGEDDGTSIALAVTNTVLGDEVLAADNLDLARAEESAGPTVSRITTNFTDDTLQVTSTWVAGDTAHLDEGGLFTTTAEATGVLGVRNVFDDPLSLVATDNITYIIRVIFTG